MDDFEEIYEVFAGYREADVDTEWVKCVMAKGTPCADAHNLLWDARVSLCQRLNVDLDDKDISHIMDAVMTIEREMALGMFQCGIEYAQRGCVL